MSKLNKFLSTVFVACLLAISNEVRTLSHIPLKGLFTVLKNNDIGFGHALLHSGWIANVYQYGPGKPYIKMMKRRNREQFKCVEKEDEVANLVREFWFRVSEHQQLLPTKFGCLAYIPDSQLGVFFGKLINYVYFGFPPKKKEELIDELLKYDPEYQQEIYALLQEVQNQKYRLEDEKFALRQASAFPSQGSGYGAQALSDRKDERLRKEIKKVKGFFKDEMLACKKAIAKASKEWGDKPGFSKKKKEIEDRFKWKECMGEYTKIIQEIKKQVYKNIDSEILKEYCEIQAAIKKMDAIIIKKERKKRQEIQKALFDPIKKALQFCKSGDVYLCRTVEAIIWALFFNKLDKLRSREDKITAINDCLTQIDQEFKYNNLVLKDLYTKKDLEVFEEKIKKMGASIDIFTPYDLHKQIHAICDQYDIGLHYVISLVTCGGFPPIVTRGDFGYEYEQGKLSEIRPDCYENAILDAISILWYNKEKKCFDDSLFSDHVINRGQGLKKLREALKYFYLADKKSIKGQEYTGISKSGRFTSLDMLKKLGKITSEEVENLDISQVPVSYITRSEIKQEFFNIVSELPEVVYCSEVEGKGKVFELESDVDSFIKVFNCFYGTDVSTSKGICQVVGLSTDERKIIFKKIVSEDSPPEITISVINHKKNEHFNLIFSIDDHTLVFPERAKSFFGALKDDIVGVTLKKILSNFQDIISKERCLSIFTLLVNQRLLERESLKSLNWQTPILNLAYYGMNPKVARNRALLIRDVLTWGVQFHKGFEDFADNLVESWSFNDQKLEYELSKIIIETGFYSKASVYKKFVDERLLNNPLLYERHDKVIQILKLALKHKVTHVAYVLLKSRAWAIYEWDLAEALYINLVCSGDISISLEIMNHPKFSVIEPEIGKALVFALSYQQENPLEKKWEKIITRIVKDSTFNQWGAALEEALKRRSKSIALKIVTHENFDPNEDDYYMQQAWGLMLQIKKYHHIALQIINNLEFNARAPFVKSLLINIKKLKEKMPELKFELQETIKIIKEKRGYCE